MNQLARKQNERNANQYTKNNNNNELPRTKETINYDPFSGYNGPRINVHFTTPAGNSVIINAPTNAKIYDLLFKYMLRIQLGPNLINNGIYFIANGRKIRPEDNDKLVGNIFLDNVTIIVIDQKGLIGGLN